MIPLATLGPAPGGSGHLGSPLSCAPDLTDIFAIDPTSKAFRKGLLPTTMSARSAPPPVDCRLAWPPPRSSTLAENSAGITAGWWCLLFPFPLLRPCVAQAVRGPKCHQLRNDDHQAGVRLWSTGEPRGRRGMDADAHVLGSAFSRTPCPESVADDGTGRSGSEGFGRHQGDDAQGNERRPSLPHPPSFALF